MLNPAQQQGVIRAGHCLISACPGAGKTTVLSHRAAHLLTLSDSAQLAAVTFTNEAASELGSRVAKMAPGQARRIIAGTFHKLAKDQLVASGLRVRLITEVQARGLTAMCMREVGAIGKAEEAYAYIQEKKSRDPDSLAIRSKGDAGLDNLCRAYDAALRSRGLHDFQDLILLAVQGMRAKTVKPLAVRYMLVDEVQDADELQWAWVLEHLAAGTEVTCVGDDDQTIYGWRQASGYQGMQSFISRTGATWLPMDTTYRCAPEILRLANQLILHNRARLPKSLTTANTSTGLAYAKTYPTRQSEAQAIALQIQSGRPEEWAILARTNGLLDGVEHALDTLGINSRRVGGTSFWQRDRAGLYLSVLESICKNEIHGIEALLHALSVRTDTVNSLIGKCDRRHPGSFQRFLDLPLPRTSSGKLVTELQNKCRDWQGEFSKGLSGVDTVLLGVQMFMDTYLPRPPAKDKEGKAKNSFLAVCAIVLVGRTGSLENRLSEVTRKKSRDQPGVSLITCHGCKGLEFDRIWLMGCEHGVFPDDRSDIEEERRLFYVGMTRARIELIVSGCQSETSILSSFVAEAGFQVLLSA